MPSLLASGARAAPPSPKGPSLEDHKNAKAREEDAKRAAAADESKMAGVNKVMRFKLLVASHGSFFSDCRLSFLLFDVF